MVMEKVRNRKWACLILAVIVMISGICMERVPANAFFSCTKSSSITGMDSIYKDLTVYRTETLNQQEVIDSIRLTGRDARRSQVRATVSALYFSCADILPPYIQSAGITGKSGLCFDAMCSLAILTYIHNQDGEKA